MNDTAIWAQTDRRRRRRDSLTRTVQGLKLLSLGLLVALAIIVMSAQPSSFSLSGKQAAMSSVWDKELVLYATYLMGAGLLIGVTGLCLNCRRLKRANDCLSIPLLLVLLVSIIGLGIRLLFV